MTHAVSESEYAWLIDASAIDFTIVGFTDSPPHEYLRQTMIMHA